MIQDFADFLQEESEQFLRAKQARKDTDMSPSDGVVTMTTHENTGQRVTPHNTFPVQHGDEIHGNTAERGTVYNPSTIQHYGLFHGNTEQMGISYSPSSRQSGVIIHGNTGQREQHEDTIHGNAGQRGSPHNPSTLQHDDIIHGNAGQRGSPYNPSTLQHDTILGNAGQRGSPHNSSTLQHDDIILGNTGQRGSPYNPSIEHHDDNIHGNSEQTEQLDGIINEHTKHRILRYLLSTTTPGNTGERGTPHSPSSLQEATPNTSSKDASVSPSDGVVTMTTHENTGQRITPHNTFPVQHGDEIHGNTDERGTVHNPSTIQHYGLFHGILQSPSLMQSGVIIHRNVQQMVIPHSPFSMQSGGVILGNVEQMAIPHSPFSMLSGGVIHGNVVQMVIPHSPFSMQSGGVILGNVEQMAIPHSPSTMQYDGVIHGNAEQRGSPHNPSTLQHDDTMHGNTGQREQHDDIILGNTGQRGSPHNPSTLQHDDTIRGNTGQREQREDIIHGNTEQRGSPHNPPLIQHDERIRGNTEQREQRDGRAQREKLFRLLTMHMQGGGTVTLGGTGECGTPHNPILVQEDTPVTSSEEECDVQPDVGAYETVTCDGTEETATSPGLQSEQLGISLPEYDIDQYPGFRFDMNHGTQVQLLQERRMASRTDYGTGNGIVLSEDPMQRDFLYEVALDEVSNSRSSDMGTLLGVTYGFHNQHVLPYTCNCSDLRFISVTPWGVWVEGVQVKWNMPELLQLPKDSRVGLLVDRQRGLRLYINGRPMGTMALNVPQPCYFMFDLFGYCLQVVRCPPRYIPGDENTPPATDLVGR